MLQTTCSDILLLEEVNISLFFLFPAATPLWFRPSHQGKKAFYSQKDKSELILWFLHPLKYKRQFGITEIKLWKRTTILKQLYSNLILQLFQILNYKFFLQFYCIPKLQCKNMLIYSKFSSSVSVELNSN